MQTQGGAFIYSATDLNNFLECRRLTELEALVALRRLERPIVEDPQLALIGKKGDEHESAYLAQLKAKYGEAQVVEFPSRSEFGIEAYHAAEQRTLDAMHAGAKIIYQATFFDGTFIGHADFLRRVEVPSKRLGDYSYEVLDTKLALSVRPYFLLQLCNYSEHLERLQGMMPHYAYVVLGNGREERFRLNDYLAYYRRVKTRFLSEMTSAGLTDQPRAYPVPCSHCDICVWDGSCAGKRRKDDHLSLVAGMRRDQTTRLEEAGVTTVVALTHAENPPPDMRPATFEKLRHQATLQVRGRTEGPIYELLPHDPELGFGLLPEPARGDVFFDMEGDPLYAGGKLEYLFGCWLPDDEEKFRSFWGPDREREREAFEGFIDFIMERRTRYPDLRVYHYAPYEKTYLGKLAQIHGTREDEVDLLLRSEILVDLYAVVRQAVLTSQDGYGIKKLERYYGMTRATDVRKGDDSIVMFEKWLELGNSTEADAIKNDIIAYNRDDCESTWRLREWLLKLRGEAIVMRNIDLPFRPAKDPDAPCHAEFDPSCKKCKDQRETERLSAMELHLRARPESSARTLGHLLAYHRREEKTAWWAFFDRHKRRDDLESDSEAIGGLVYIEGQEPKNVQRSLAFAYAMPEQVHKMKEGQKGVFDARNTAKAIGEILEIDESARTLVLKSTCGVEVARGITALMPGHNVVTKLLRQALGRVGERYLDGTLRATHPSTADILERRAPRTTLGSDRLQPQHVDATEISRVVRALDHSYLFIQGPPGTGKTRKSASVICDLLEDGKRVGVTSNSHKAVHNLFEQIEREAARRNKRFSGKYKHSDATDESEYASPLAEASWIASTKEPASFDGNDYQLAGGTAWLFAREQLAGAFDYLFIDEAGQVSLANAVASMPSAANIVLLGDPSQLANVVQGSHDEGADESVLTYLFEDQETIGEDRGILLNISYRMNPEICSFISEAVYDGRLEAGEMTKHHRVASPDFAGAGLRYEPIEHRDNGTGSLEEATRIVEAVKQLRVGTVTDDDGVPRALQDSDIIVVTPYNRQQRIVERALRDAGYGVEVGTVDKFQGREAAVVLYSMAASSTDDLPRGIDFLFARNRFNVAISRARALAAIICSPALLDVPVRTTAQMAAVNLLCEYAERASLAG